MGKSSGIEKGRYWPNFESLFLTEIVNALQKRSKSIKHGVSKFSCERVRENIDGNSQEIVELSFDRIGPYSPRISVKIWDDRWLWIDVRQSSETGWVFEWQHEGRVGDTDPKAVSIAILETVKGHYAQDLDAALDELDSLWPKIAKSGPID